MSPSTTHLVWYEWGTRLSAKTSETSTHYDYRRCYPLTDFLVLSLCCSFVGWTAQAKNPAAENQAHRSRGLLESSPVPAWGSKPAVPAPGCRLPELTRLPCSFSGAWVACQEDRRWRSMGSAQWLQRQRRLIPTPRTHAQAYIPIFNLARSRSCLYSLLGEGHTHK